METDPEAARHWRGSVRVRTERGTGPAIPWARVGADALRRLAAPLGLAVVAERPGPRAFAALRR